MGSIIVNTDLSFKAKAKDSNLVFKESLMPRPRQNVSGARVARDHHFH